MSTFREVVPVIQSIGIVGSLLIAAFALRLTTRTTRAQCLLSITNSHREIWRAVTAQPALSNALDPAADPTAITNEERYFLRELILHLSACHEAERLGSLPTLENIDSDVRQLLSRPMPRKVWAELKPYQNKRFVEFVEKQLNLQDASEALQHEAS